MRTIPERTNTATLTTTEAAVLALLALEGERSGYDLLKLVAKAIAHVWTPARSQLYAVLPRLVDAKLARRRSVEQSSRPDKQVYRLTRRGRAVLDEWLRAEPDSLETFHLRLFVGALVPRDVLVPHVRWFRRATEERLEEYRRIEPTNSRRGNDLFHWFELRRAIELCEHELRWASWVLRELGR